MKRPAKAPRQTDDDFEEVESLFNYKVNDLKRYGIEAILLDDFEEIEAVLNEVRCKMYNKSIFISGAAEKFSRLGKVENGVAETIELEDKDAAKFIVQLASSLVSAGARGERVNKIVSGFGHKVGGLIIDGVNNYVFASKSRRLDDYLLLRPFPRNPSDATNKQDNYRKYRQEMISQCGIIIYLFGNRDGKGHVVQLSQGMEEEFDIAQAQNLIHIPVGYTGWKAHKLWIKVMENHEAYYDGNKKLTDAVGRLGPQSGQEPLWDGELVTAILKAVKAAQEKFLRHLSTKHHKIGW